MGKPRRANRTLAEPRRSTPSRVEVWAEIAIGLLLLVSAVLYSPLAKESFRLPKLLASEWLGLASLVPLGLGLRAVERVGWQDLRRTRALVAILPLLGLATLSLATTRHPLPVGEALKDLWIGAACLVGWSAGLSRWRLERLGLWLLVPAAGMALLGILQFHGLYEPLSFAGIAYDRRLAITALAGNPGDLAAYLVLPCLFAQWGLYREAREARGARGGRRGGVLAAYGFALAVGLYALAATQTLAALLAVGAGSLLLWGFLAPRRRLLPIAGGALALSLLLVFAVGPLRTRVMAKAGQLAGGNWNQLLTGRLDGWRAATWMLARNPLAGVGHGAFGNEFVPAKLALLAGGTHFLLDQPNVTFANAHNEFLEVGAELGVPGLLALGWGLWILFGSLRRSGSDPAGHSALAWGGTVALAVLALFHFPFRVALVGFPALLFLAWVLAASPADDGEEVAS